MNQFKSFIFNSRRLILLAAIALVIVLVGSSFSSGKLSLSQFLTPSSLKTQAEVTNTSSTCPNSNSLPWLQIDGKWIEDEAGNKVTLRGMSFCGFDNAWSEKAHGVTRQLKSSHSMG